MVGILGRSRVSNFESELNVTDMLFGITSLTESCKLVFFFIGLLSMVYVFQLHLRPT